MEVSEDSTLEDFQRWHVTHLRDYLAKRGLSRTGKKSELAALAYSCHVMKKPIVDHSGDNISESFVDYQAILHLPNGSCIPDPFKIKNGWLSENDNGMKYWPPVSIVDIVDFFREQHTSRDKMHSDCKAGKAYDYFKTEWLKEIYYNSMKQILQFYPGIEKYCLLRANCTPSERINDPAHDVWVVVEKETGQILRGYCNCTSG